MSVTHLRHALVFLPLAALTLLVPVPAQAHGPGDGSSDPASFGLGLAVISEVRPYRGVDDENEVVPVVAYENRWVRLFGPQLQLKLGSAGPFDFGLTLSYSRDGYKPGDSPALAGMERRRDGFWAGARAGLKTEVADLSIDWSADASGHSEGQRFKVGVQRRFGAGGLGVTPRLAATWLDRRLVQYYYGVEAAQARADRAAYHPGSTVNTEVGVRLDHRLAPQQMLFADIGVVGLGRAIRASPLVDRRTVPELRLGWMYRF